MRRAAPPAYGEAGHVHVHCNPCNAEFCATHQPHMEHVVPGIERAYLCARCSQFVLRAAVLVSDDEKEYGL